MQNRIMLERRKSVRIGDLLVQYNLISPEQLNEALRIQQQTHQFLGHVLIDLKYITEDVMIAALSEQLNLDIVELIKDKPNEQVIKKYERFAKYFNDNNCIPFDENVQLRTLFIATSNPLNNTFFNQLASTLGGYNIKVKLALSKDVTNAIQKYYGDYFTKTILNRIDISSEQTTTKETNVVIDKENEDDSPVITLVNNIFTNAVRLGSSDIHIEPLEDRVRVRYRIDGDLHEKEVYASSLLSSIVTRIKVVGGMKLEEKRKPQDGRWGINVGGIDYDVRISMLPTVYGEKCVMRLTNKERLTMDKKNLGLLPDDEKKFDSLLKNTNGIILVTGPTGSGKSTTLYTALSELNKENVNISTIEDPVEANIEGLNQVQINNDAGLTFPSALRCFLRQDPDIIMVGEIRDRETASLAVDAALTGHLVVSTLHTNSSISSISRLEKMGIESYLLADALCGVLAQRLVKRLCSCKQKRNISVIDRKKLGLKDDEEVEIYDPKGCPLCENSGYKGRIAIYEILMFTKDLKDAVADEKPISFIENLAKEEGLVKLKESCIEQIKRGVTSIEEMDRVVHENSIEFMGDDLENTKEDAEEENIENKEDSNNIKEAVNNISNTNEIINNTNVNQKNGEV